MDFFTALKQNINEYIVANGNKEITADILRPILLEICNITFAKMGDLELLQTVYKTDLVGAINEALNAESGVKIHYGDFPNPNDVEIPNFELGDFYAQQGDTGIVSFWQYNGQEWIRIANSGEDFIPAEHDLDEFKNQSTNPFARMDDLESAILEWTVDDWS